MRGYPSSISLCSLAMIRCGTRCWFPCRLAHGRCTYRPPQTSPPEFVGIRIYRIQGRTSCSISQVHHSSSTSFIHHLHILPVADITFLPNRTLIIERASLTDLLACPTKLKTSWYALSLSPLFRMVLGSRILQSDSCTYWPPVHAQHSSTPTSCLDYHRNFVRNPY